MAEAHDWTSKDSENDWQAILPERVPPSRIFVVKCKTKRRLKETGIR